MTDNTAIYALNAYHFSVEEIEALTEEADIVESPNGTILVSWEDVELRLAYMAESKLDEHKRGFAGFVLERNGGEEDGVLPLLDHIASIQTVVGCEIEPGFDPGNKARSLIVSLAVSYEEALLFADNSIYAPYGQLLYGPPGGGPYAVIDDLDVRRLAVDDGVITEAQTARRQRVRSVLGPYNVPQYDGHIRWMSDDNDVELRTPKDVAMRVVAMHALVCYARGQPREEVQAELDRTGAMEFFSPDEAEFFSQSEPDEAERQQLIWRLESLWVLMWSLGHIDRLEWPNRQCDVERLHELVFKATEDIDQFVNHATLRSKSEIMDMTEVIVRIHWAIRQAYVEELEVPANLNWTEPSGMVRVGMCPQVPILMERHRTLNWLICFGDDEWDDVDVPT